MFSKVMMVDVQMEQSTNPALLNRQIFDLKSGALGIPKSILAISMIVSLFSGYLLLKFLGAYMGGITFALFLALVFIPLYQVHQDDPYGYLVSLGSLISPRRYSTTLRRRKKIVLARWVGAQIIVSDIHTRKSR
ncbi:hypothetical protein WH50_06395 [Pokkaliibacter plantistimulans]|uniref:Signal peptidase complex subunit 1 n=1 Tax=Pokkaliibacter plantistimulans TaxID=1635171 RepID=A0ABX5M113_9GAMM|nr:hypothetical protein WH50_06395 [Pokkaliibacter plantistimulans]